MFTLTLAFVLPLLCAITHAKNTIHFDGVAHTQLSSSKEIEVKFDDYVICPKKRYECFDDCDYDFECDYGYKLHMPDVSKSTSHCYIAANLLPLQSAIAGPWKFQLTIPGDLVFDSEIPRDDIECDAYQCGGKWTAWTLSGELVANKMHE